MMKAASLRPFLLASCVSAGGVLWAVPTPPAARPSYDGSAPTCYLTAGGALEICRDGSEAEGVLAAPTSCDFARGIQLLRLPRAGTAGPVQAIFQGASPLPKRRRDDDCAERRATDARDGGSLQTGRQPEQLATILPPSEVRFGVALPKEPSRRRRDDVPSSAKEGIGPRDPIAIAGRDWAGEEYFYVFLLGQESAAPQFDQPEERGRRPRRRSRRDKAETATPPALRRIQIAARTLDFVSYEIRTRTETGTLAWVPFSLEDRRRSAPVPAAVLDETGKSVSSACPAAPFQTQGLAGSISIVDQTYYYFYTDILPEDCNNPVETRRTGLFLRTATDLAADKVWSAARRVGPALPPNSLVRVARAKGGSRWAVSYTCNRPANAPGGPVADICLQYTADLDPAGIGTLTLFADPIEAGRSPAYLGLRSGGNGSGRFDRSAHFWMTDSHGNLDVPSTYAGKSGLLTWVDQLAPGAGGVAGSQVYGRPAYWATWTVRRTGTP